MSEVVIRVENISKLYRLGEVGTGSLAHDVKRWWHKVRGKEDPYLKIGEVNDRTKSVSSVQSPESSAKKSNLTTEDTESTERGAGGNLLIRVSFWKATRKLACRWTPKNSLPVAPRMTPALPGTKLVRILNP